MSILGVWTGVETLYPPGPSKGIRGAMAKVLVDCGNCAFCKLTFAYYIYPELGNKV